MDTHYRQGDVMLVRVNEIPVAAVPAEDEPRVILAYGEVTGHAHALEPIFAKLYNCGADRYLVTKTGATLRHEEHGPIELPAGFYKVIRQREYTPLEIRPVCD